MKNFTLSNFNWGPALFLIIYQIFFLISFPIYLYYMTPSIGMVFTTFILLYLTGLSITVGYHRFYSHRSYRTNKFVEAVLLFFGAMATQGSALRWSFDHRLHHAHVDTDEDPYSINKGFWYAHCLWILEKPRKIEAKVIPDLMKNSFVQFQHRYYEILMVLTNALAFVFVGWLLNDYVGAFFLAVLARLFLLHHFTWFINSLAHTWGDKPFCQEQSAVNNFVIALLTFGEGYHNFHHTFANDYRNGIKWYHFDPSKWVIWTLNKLRLADSLKQVDAFTIKKRMVTERKNLLLEKLSDLWYVKKDELEISIKDLSDKLLVEFARMNQLKDQYRSLRRDCEELSILEDLKKEIADLKKNLKEDWHLWVNLSQHILKLQPLELKTV